ncbi:hypothetical protein BHM03_00044568 [Ensete ventricosum]|nr:hypothetical protein BHM03_00044568 [Ensete ventricosum]
MRKHKSRHGEGSYRATARGKEPVALTEEDSFPVYRRPKLMKDLCGTRVCMDDEGSYVLQMADWTPKDPAAAMRARWPNLSYTAKVWDDSQVASKFGRGVLHPTLAKDLYTLPSEILMAQATKQIALVSYEYRYRVTLARFQARYPNLEVDSNPFTEKPEDSLAPMETRQEFNDSIPPGYSLPYFVRCGMMFFFW